jgi:membrane protease YdiL (CAAX protease family)
MQLALPDTALERTILLTLAFAPIFLLLWAWLKWYEKRPFWTLGLEWQGVWFKYLRGLLVGLVMFAGSVGISAVFGFMAFEEQGPQPQGLAALGGVLLVFVGWTVQGPAEEALARGWLLPVIGARHKPLWGIVISALVFAVYHSLNPNLSPIAFLNLFLFGVLTAFYALYEGGLWGVFGIHAAWNWAQGNIFGLEVSGIPPAGGTLFNLMETGPDAITGGQFGPEGGLAVTAVLIVSSIIVWLIQVRN